MNDYYKVRVQAEPCTCDITDLAAAFMADAGFESFEPDDNGLTAYISVKLGDGAAIASEALADFPMDTKFDISSEYVEGRDWNEEWEKNYFKPIVIEGRCVIHSTFHKDVPQAEYDVVIDPRMAFGTGHHDTTSQMVQHILESDLEGKTVIDMGTGTGILGILCAMRGAAKVTGIEIDEPAYLNALDHVALNGVRMDVVHGDASALGSLEPADLFLANINRNIITADIGSYAARLKRGGEMCLSGFYEEDIPVIAEAASHYGMHETERKVSNRWAAVRFVKDDKKES